MRRVIQAIEGRTSRFEQHALFEFMRTEALSPYRRLGFFPCLAPLVMSLGNIERDIVGRQEDEGPQRYEETWYAIADDPTVEHDVRRTWYMRDAETLGLCGAHGGDWAHAFIDERFPLSRAVPLQLGALLSRGSATERLVIIKVLDAFDEVMAVAARRVARDFERASGRGPLHLGTGVRLSLEGHCNRSVRRREDTRLDRQGLLRHLNLALEMFGILESWADEMLRCAQSTLHTWAPPPPPVTWSSIAGEYRPELDFS